MALALPSGTAIGDEARIGLFLAAGDGGATAVAELRRGAELAAAECAAAASRCALVPAEAAGHWNAGAGELVRLVYREGVPAVLGPADGRTAHLAEQVVARAKGRFVLLTPWVSDPTLTQIKVPWVFRLAADDRSQARALSREIFDVRRTRSVAVVAAASDYDSRVASAAFEAVARRSGAPELQKIELDGAPAALDRLAAEVRRSHVDALIVLAPPAAAARAVRHLRQEGITIPLFGPLALASPAFLHAAGDASEGIVLAAPPEPSAADGVRFRDRYRKAYNRDPSAPAAYGYDGAAVLIAALRASGAGGESLRAALAATRYEGLTGPIAFDAAGNRAGPAPLARVERGRLEPIAHQKDPPGAAPNDLVSIR